MKTESTTPAIELGQVVITQGVQSLADFPSLKITDLLHRHASGDWGNLDEEDAAANDHAILNKERILSSYLLAGEKVWIITEWDRSVTTILLPKEY